MRKRFSALAAIATAVTLVSLSGPAGASPSGAATTYDISTLAGKVASVNGTAGLQIRMSAFLQEEADASEASAPTPATPITPSFVLSSPLDGNTVLPPAPTASLPGPTTTSPGRGRARSAAPPVVRLATPTRAPTSRTTAASRGAARAATLPTLGR
jgi:hypothetical protein